MAVPSFPEFSVTGPVHHFIAPPAAIGSTTYYLGTCEVQPSVRWQQMTQAWMNDTHGRSLPAQMKDDGEMASIVALLNRFSRSALDFLGVLSGTAGRQGRFSRGQPIFGRKTFRLWMLFENYLDPTTRALYPGLPIGYFWPQVRWIDMEDMPGNQDAKKVCAWDALPYFTPQASASAVQAGEREFLLYSTSEADFPDAVRVPQ